MNYTAGLGGKLTGSPLCAVLLVVAVLGLWLAQRASGQRALRAWRLTASVLSAAVLIGAVVFVCLVFVNTRHPGSLGRLSDHSIFTFDAKWGSSRGATWTIGLRCFAEQDVLHKLVGAGPDCMADFLSNGSSEALLNAVQTAFDGKRLTNAHCELLTILVNTGLLGAVSFAGMMWMAVKRLLGARDRNGYAGACGLCVLAYIANNLWSFQQSMSVTTIFVILGMGEYFLRRIRLLPSEGVAGIG
jgi:O-antigen ligase